MTTTLENIVAGIHIDDKNGWAPIASNKFSHAKELHEHQVIAIKNAAKALWLYYSNHEASSDNARKEKIAQQYEAQDVNIDNVFGLSSRDTAFALYQKFLANSDGVIEPKSLINRMGFWMATGSGKTLVIVKLIAHLDRLMREKKIPYRKILVLAPSEHALSQFCNIAREFEGDEPGRKIDLRPLREFGAPGELPLNRGLTVYYCRSDLLSDEKKEIQLNWADFDCKGEWFVLLDEAHKGERSDSFRKAYASLLARNGFLFNFSATLIESPDICSTAYSHNLSRFIQSGHGKKIRIAKSSFENLDALSDTEKQGIVMEPLIALAVARKSIKNLREQGGKNKLYHAPLMLTLGNTVNTESERNDLAKFFAILRQIAANDIGSEVFRLAKEKYIANWSDSPFYGDDDSVQKKEIVKQITEILSLQDLRAEIFGAPDPGNLMYKKLAGTKSEDNRQIAFQSSQSEKPFALLSVGDVSRWENQILEGMEVTSTFDKNENWFRDIDGSENFSILMGSRKFYESWDSTRPNIINFINIGMNNSAKIFVMQSTGRGVRIEPLPGMRKRLSGLLPYADKDKEKVLKSIKGQEAPPETLFIYATSRNAIESVLSHMTQGGGGQSFRILDEDENGTPLFKKITRPSILGGTPVPRRKQMPLLIPMYDDSGTQKLRVPILQATEQTADRLRKYLSHVTDGTLIVTHGLPPEQVCILRKTANSITISADYPDYSIQAVIRLIVQEAYGIPEHKEFREMGENGIVHFADMKASLPEDLFNDLVRKIARAGNFKKDMSRLLAQLRAKEISDENFLEKFSEIESQRKFDHPNEAGNLNIHHCVRHYYSPLVIADQPVSFFQYAIDVDSERKFLNELESFLKTDGGQEVNKKWAWMFSKINEHKDKDMYIPYKGGAKFIPDFIFWLCRRKGSMLEYRIVFVDPKGTEHADTYRKLDGYMALYTDGQKPKIFSHTEKSTEYRVSVHLWMHTSNLDSVPEQYRHLATSNLSDIFKD